MLRWALKVPLKIVRDSYADGRVKYEAQLMLVRPDQFIVWVGDGLRPDAARIMGRVSGRS